MNESSAAVRSKSPPESYSSPDSSAAAFFLPLSAALGIAPASFFSFLRFGASSSAGRERFVGAEDFFLFFELAAGAFFSRDAAGLHCVGRETPEGRRGHRVTNRVFAAEVRPGRYGEVTHRAVVAVVVTVVVEVEQIPELFATGLASARLLLRFIVRAVELAENVFEVRLRHVARIVRGGAGSIKSHSS